MLKKNLPVRIKSKRANNSLNPYFNGTCSKRAIFCKTFCLNLLH